MSVIYFTILGLLISLHFYAGDCIEAIPIKFIFFAILACTSIITPEIDLGEKFLKRSSKMDEQFERCKDVKNKSGEDHDIKCRQGKSGGLSKQVNVDPVFKNIFD